MEKVIVVKIGGAVLGRRDTTIEDIIALQQQGRPVILVHGGGNMVTDWLSRQGIATRFIRGERVTDKPALEVVTAVLSGLANKEFLYVHRGVSDTRSPRNRSYDSRMVGIPTIHHYSGDWTMTDHRCGIRGYHPDSTGVSRSRCL